MPRANDSRQRMLISAATLMAQRGVGATGLREVAEHAGVSRGSISHHFPGGKAEMVGDAVRLAGSAAAATIADSKDTASAIDSICDIYRAALEHSDFRAACPVGALAAEAQADPALTAAAAGVFEEWRVRLVELLEAEGTADPVAAADLAIASVEGALLLCRVQRSVEPLEHVRDGLHRALA